MIRLPTFAAASLFWATLAGALPAALAQGEIPADPWSREVAVADRGLDERREAQSLAMREVLLANSGDKTLLNRDDVRAALRDAEGYVGRFDYRTPPPGTLIEPGTPLTDAVRESGEATQLMRVSFDRERLRALIAGDGEADTAEAPADEAADDPFLAVDSALVWLLIEDGRREILVSDPAARNVRARAREIAGARGLALRYPTGDDEDGALVGAEDIRAADLERLRPASERYAETVVLAGHLARDGMDAWEGTWTRFAGEASESETFTTDSLDEALQAGIAWLSAAAPAGEDSYRYGGDAVSDTEALVWVGALDSVNAYATVMDFLAGVPGVGTVYPKEIDERGMTFTVVPRGALPAIAAAAEALPWLRRTSPPRDVPDPGFDAPGSRTPPPGAGAEPAASDATDASLPGRPLPDERTPDVRTPPPPLARDAELAFDYLR